jgi:maltose-binding protein MalE
VERVNADPKVSDRDKQAISTMVECVARSKTIPMIPQYPQIQEVLAVVTSSVMSKAQQPAEALQAGQKRLEGILKT